MLTLEQFQTQHFMLNAQEKRLLKNCVAGEWYVIHQVRPEKAIKRGKNSNVIRMEFIRWLALGGDTQYPLHALGIRLMGAWLEGVLNLHGATIRSDLLFLNCYVAQASDFESMRLDGSLIISGSLFLKGLRADRAKIAGSFFLRENDQNRFESQGEIRLVNATIEGNFDCSGAQLNGSNGQDALIADGAKIAGDMIINAKGQHRFESRGAIRLLGAIIKGNLDCCGAQLNGYDGQNALIADGANIAGAVFLSRQDLHRFESQGEIRFVGATIGRDLACIGAQLKGFDGQSALSAEGAEIVGSVFLRGDFKSDGTLSFISTHIAGVFQLRAGQAVSGIDLSHATIGFLQSKPTAWGKHIVLDGLVYGSLREAHWQAIDYLDWLNKQTSADLGFEKVESFKPQPWHQLIGVLLKMGHQDIATEISIAYEKHRYTIGKVGAYQVLGDVDGKTSFMLPVTHFFKRANQSIAKFFHATFGLLAGYGYKPLRLLWWMLFVWLFSAAMYFCAAYHGIFTPSDPLVFQNVNYEHDCRSFDMDGTARTIHNQDEHGVTHNWYTCGELMGEYTTFSPVAYSLDVILPLVDLGQEKTWGVYIESPAANGAVELLTHWSWNHAARLLVWFEVLFGWMASLMLVAVLTGLTERERS